MAHLEVKKKPDEKVLVRGIDDRLQMVLTQEDRDLSAKTKHQTNEAAGKDGRFLLAVEHDEVRWAADNMLTRVGVVRRRAAFLDITSPSRCFSRRRQGWSAHNPLVYLQRLF